MWTGIPHRPAFTHTYPLKGHTLITFHARTPDLRPARGHALDAGYDVRADLTAALTIRPNETVKVATGVKVCMPASIFCDVRTRSGHAARGLIVTNSPGTIDAGYTGEVVVMLTNLSARAYTVEPGERVAQLTFAYNPLTTELVEVEAHDGVLPDLDEDSADGRGSAGFGSTGVM